MTGSQNVRTKKKKKKEDVVEQQDGSGRIKGTKS